MGQQPFISFTNSLILAHSIPSIKLAVLSLLHVPKHLLGLLCCTLRSAPGMLLAMGGTSRILLCPIEGDAASCHHPHCAQVHQTPLAPPTPMCTWIIAVAFGYLLTVTSCTHTLATELMKTTSQILSLSCPKSSSHSLISHGSKESTISCYLCHSTAATWPCSSSLNTTHAGASIGTGSFLPLEGHFF